MFGEDDLVRSHKRRADAIANIVFVCFAIILARLWFLQIYKGDILYKYSQENRLRKENVLAPRGMIFSRNNQMMVHNVPRFDAVITPQYLTNKKETIKKVSEILGMKEKSILRVLAKNRGQARYRPVTIKKNISRKEVAVIETEVAKMPGVGVNTFISREYQDAEVGGHVLGYISEISQHQLPRYRKRDKFNYKLGDFIGQAGIEERFDLYLRGEDGHEFMEVDARGRMKRHISTDNLFHEISNKTASPGNNIRLTIDRDLQKAAYDSLEGKVGGVVAVDVDSGEVLAMVSRPGFDPSQFSRGLTTAYWKSLSNDPGKPMRNKTIQDHYMPGSTYKPITLIAALEEGIVDESTEVHCPGWFRLGRRKFHCWKKHGHGKVDAIKAIRESCDVYFYKIATKLDINILAKYSRALGFGSKTTIALPRETSGLIPTKEWKQKKTGEPWQKGETLSCVIGQSYILSTPLQLAMSYASIANGGTLHRPHLLKEIFSTDGKIIKDQAPEVISKMQISEKTLQIVRKGLWEVVNKRKGTAWWYRGRGIDMAGKTGTSQVVRFSADKIFSKCENNPYELRHHGLFVAYAPAVNPKISIGVIVEHGCHGSSAAAPVARAVAEKYMSKYMPELKKKLAKKQNARYKKLLKKNKKAKVKKESSNE